MTKFQGNSGYRSVVVDGGDGKDQITVSASFSTTIKTGAGVDTIVLTTSQYKKLLVGARHRQPNNGTILPSAQNHLLSRISPQVAVVM